MSGKIHNINSIWMKGDSAGHNGTVSLITVVRGMSTAPFTTEIQMECLCHTHIHQNKYMHFITHN